MKKNFFLFFLFFITFLFIETGIIKGIVWSEEFPTNFRVSSPGYDCSNDGNYWITFSNGIEGEISTQESCFLDDGPLLTCCPENSLCNLSTGQCDRNIIIRFCGDYEDEESCTHYNSQIGILSVEEITSKEGFCNGNSILTNDGCFEFISDCRCEWDNKKDRCIASYDSEEICLNPPNPSANKINGNCTFDMKINNDCNESGIYSIETSASWAGNVDAFGYSECKNASFSVSCGNSLKLSFFTEGIFLCSIFLIFVLYFFSYFKNNFI